MDLHEANAVRQALDLLKEASKEREAGNPEAMALEFEARIILARLLADQEPARE